MGEKKHINKNPPKIPGQSRENFVYVFFSLCFFFFFFSLPSCMLSTFVDVCVCVTTRFLTPRFVAWQDVLGLMKH